MAAPQPRLLICPGGWAATPLRFWPACAAPHRTALAGKEVEVSFDLLVGADGANSGTRALLQAADPDLKAGLLLSPPFSPCGRLWSTFAPLPSSSCGLLCSLAFTGMLLGLALSPCWLTGLPPRGLRKREGSATAPAHERCACSAASACQIFWPGLGGDVSLSRAAAPPSPPSPSQAAVK